MLVAIWGHETSYGAVTGNFDLLNSLATLAYEGRRRQLFADEFVAALKMIDRGVPAQPPQGQLGGRHRPSPVPAVASGFASAATATATAAPTSGEASPTRSPRSPIISATPAGSPDVPWGVAVRVPPSSTAPRFATRLRAPRCPRVHERHSRWMTIAEWRRLGLVAQNGIWPRDTEMATLIEPDGPGADRLSADHTITAPSSITIAPISTLCRSGLLADAIAR